ncbi:MAG: YbjN domain-containing protein [Sandaracinaceae bacterium]
MRALFTLLGALTLPLLATPCAAQETPEEPTRAVESVEAGQPRYLAAMQAELTAMRVQEATCETVDPQRAHCSFTARGISTGRDFNVHMVYSDRTDTIYLYVERYLEVLPDGATTNAVLRRMMELNWTLLLGKFEWDPTDGEVRLAMILNTDSNFDRRAFRSAIRGIGQLADRYAAELERAIRGQAPAAE